MLSPFAIVAGCSFGAALVGMVLHIKLPDHHLDADSRDVVKLVMGQLEHLSPETDLERMMQTRALQESEDIARSRLRMFEQLGSSISWPFLTVLVFWISMLFLGFGLFARANATVTVALLVGALSVAGAIFLILELNEPYRGIMRISDEPLRNVMAQIDR